MHTRPNVRIPAGAPLARTLVADEHAEQQGAKHVKRDESVCGEEVAAPVVGEAGGGHDQLTRRAETWRRRPVRHRGIQRGPLNQRLRPPRADVVWERSPLRRHGFDRRGARRNLRVHPRSSRATRQDRCHRISTEGRWFAHDFARARAYLRRHGHRAHARLASRIRDARASARTRRRISTHLLKTPLASTSHRARRSAARCVPRSLRAHR